MKKEKDYINDPFNDPFMLASDVESAADSALTLVECLWDIVAVNDTKLELLGSYADYYKSEVQRVDDVLYAINQLLFKIKEAGNDISLGIIARGKEGLSA